MLRDLITIDDFFSEEELKALEKKLAADVKTKSQELVQVEATYKGKLEQLYKTVMPLLNNLQKNPDKEYIYWPNRKPVIEQQIDKILKLTRD